MDKETSAHLESLHNSVNLLTENLNFIMDMDKRTLLILARLAYVLLRTTNKTFGLEEADDEPVPERIDKAFKEIRQYFDEQVEIMNAPQDGGSNG